MKEPEGKLTATHEYVTAQPCVQKCFCHKRLCLFDSYRFLGQVQQLPNYLLLIQFKIIISYKFPHPNISITDDSLTANDKRVKSKLFLCGPKTWFYSIWFSKVADHCFTCNSIKAYKMIWLLKQLGREPAFITRVKNERNFTSTPHMPSLRAQEHSCYYYY